MQPFALGAVSTRFGVPQLQGQKRRNSMYQNRVHLIGYLGKNRSTSPARRQTANTRFSFSALPAENLRLAIRAVKGAWFSRSSERSGRPLTEEAAGPGASHRPGRAIAFYPLSA